MDAWGERANVTQKFFRQMLNLQPSHLSCCEPTMSSNCTTETSPTSLRSQFPEFELNFADCLLPILQQTFTVLAASILSELSACLGKRSRLNICWVIHPFTWFSFSGCKKLVPISSNYLCEMWGVYISWTYYMSITEWHADEWDRQPFALSLITRDNLEFPTN